MPQKSSFICACDYEVSILYKVYSNCICVTLNNFKKKQLVHKDEMKWKDTFVIAVYNPKRLYYGHVSDCNLLTVICRMVVI